VPIDVLNPSSFVTKNGVMGEMISLGKARRIFEEVSKFPRHQQQILDIVEDLITSQRASSDNSAVST
jgi:hypothetical protein